MRPAQRKRYADDYLIFTGPREANELTPGAGRGWGQSPMRHLAGRVLVSGVGGGEARKKGT
jgi:hypothetical protein